MNELQLGDWVETTDEAWCPGRIGVVRGIQEIPNHILVVCYLGCHDNVVTFTYDGHRAFYVPLSTLRFLARPE